MTYIYHELYYFKIKHYIRNKSVKITMNIYINDLINKRNETRINQ